MYAAVLLLCCCAVQRSLSLLSPSPALPPAPSLTAPLFLSFAARLWLLFTPFIPTRIPSCRRRRRRRLSWTRQLPLCVAAGPVNPASGVSDRRFLCFLHPLSSALFRGLLSPSDLLLWLCLNCVRRQGSRPSVPDSISGPPVSVFGSLILVPDDCYSICCCCRCYRCRCRCRVVLLVPGLEESRRERKLCCFSRSDSP